MPLLETQESDEQIFEKNDICMEVLQNKEKRQKIVDEIYAFLDSSKSIQETEALRTENRKLKNANSRLRYKTKDWALKKEEYENEIERLSNEVSSCINVTNFWHQEVERMKEPEHGSLSSNLTNQINQSVGVPCEKIQRESKSTETDNILELQKRNAATQTCEDDIRWIRFSFSRSKKRSENK
uniref:Uncharacterized protein LOC117349855 isoform X2 n=1 Tax=Geotrypetes seraphini TaxID=260995 RepID=A0A6P8PE10_GEOSA|nr:uncharacterized protein LOC117349855 isoform X2 [Geotrypetes seraphini]